MSSCSTAIGIAARAARIADAARRLYYVAMTRARQGLTLMSP